MIAKRAEELINSAINYIINNLKNAQAAENMLLEVEYILGNLETKVVYIAGFFHNLEAYQSKLY